MDAVIEGENLKHERKMSAEKKAEYLLGRKSKATDENPFQIRLEHSELLAWQSKPTLPPQKGIFREIIHEKRGNRQVPDAVLLDFTPVVSIGIFPFARFPLSSVNIDKDTGDVYIDCSKAMKKGVVRPFNEFVPHLTRIK